VTEPGSRLRLLPWKLIVVTGVIILVLGLVIVFMPEIAGIGMKWKWSRLYAEKTLGACGARAVNQLFDQSGNFEYKKWEDIISSLSKWAEGDAQHLQYLINKLSAVDKMDYTRQTLLHHAARWDCPRLAMTLLEQGANINATAIGGSTPLHVAAESGFPGIVALFLEKGADIEAKKTYGTTPLFVAVCNGHANVVALLLKHGANVNVVTSSNGQTPLHMAAFLGNADVVSFLLDHGACFEAKNRYSMTPLHLAASHGRVDIVRQLLDRGADIEAKTYNDSTPLDFAALEGWDSVVTLLLDRGADIEGNGRSAFWSAVGGVHESTAVLLIERGANVNPIHKVKGDLTTREMTVLDMVNTWGLNHPMNEFLRRHGAKTAAELKAEADVPVGTGISGQ
jgi:ankyrin repeat protein